MSRLSRLAWRRNGNIGKVCKTKIWISSILANEDCFTDEEKEKLEECYKHLNQIYENRKENWEKIKKAGPKNDSS